MSYPTTPEQRKAGMARFRAEILKAQQSALKTAKLSKVAKAHLAEDIEFVKQVQQSKGE